MGHGKAVCQSAWSFAKYQMLDRLKLKISPLIQVIITAVLMYAISRAVVVGRDCFLGGIWLAAILVAIGGGVALLGAYEFVKVNTTLLPYVPEKTTYLVTGGIFQYSRNPMYLGFVWILFGWTVYLAQPLNFCVLLLFVMSMTQLQIKPEEAVMLQKFGDSYRDYKARVRRWI